MLKSGCSKRTWFVIGLMGLVGVGGMVTQTPAARPSQQEAFRVTSTLDGKTVLPHRIHWVAKTTLPPTQIARINFTIDGKASWHWQGTKLPVFTYNEWDASLPSRTFASGYLVTSWLTPGRHRFTVQLQANDGRLAEDTVVARVLPAPNAPAALEGTWRRTIDTTNAPKLGSPANPTYTPVPSGIYKISFDNRWVKDHFPGKFDSTTSAKSGAGLAFLNDWTPKQASFHVQGNVNTHPSWFENNVAVWCYTGGPGADYHWSVTGNTLTIAPIGGTDACAIRGFIWTGRWQRAA